MAPEKRRPEALGSDGKPPAPPAAPLPDGDNDGNSAGRVGVRVTGDRLRIGVIIAAAAAATVAAAEAPNSGGAKGRHDGSSDRCGGVHMSLSVCIGMW
jgi:hypothetical protein